MRKFNVLIVEDELIIALDLKDLLEGVDSISVQVVKNFDLAINSINIFKPDLVILDIYLGKGKTGLDLGMLLTNQYNIPFIYLTSYIDSNTIQDIINTKPYTYIAKPFKKIDLLTTVQIVINSLNTKSELINFKDKFEINNTSYVIKKILKYIDENVEKKIKIDDLVALTNWSKHHFVRMFSSQMNISPYCYVLNVKIEYAKIIILNKNIKLESIAYDLGFQSYVNFARTFKNYTKLSPKEYRDLNKTYFNKKIVNM